MPTPGSIVPSDSLIGPIQQQLALVAQQIQGITADMCYVTPTDMAPIDQGVLMPLRAWKPQDETNGKFRVTLTFEVLHCFRRDNLETVLARMQPFVLPWFTVLSAYQNQSLGGLAIEMNLTNMPGVFKSVVWGGDSFLAISNLVEVLTEFNINLN